MYHYPPSPLSKSASNRSEDGPWSYDGSSSSDTETSSTSNEDNLSDGHGRSRTKSKRANFTDEEDEDSSSPGTDDRKHGGWRVPWEHLLDLDASSLERLLMPSDRTWHKRRFEVGFNELVFVGWPIFIREDGTWQKKNRKEKASSGKAVEKGVNQGLPELPDVNIDSQEVNNQGQTAPIPSVTTDADSSPAEESREMTIFNLVFVLNPPILEYSLRVKEMYDHVVKKLGRALKWEQARANYVWKQSEIILNAKAEAGHKSSFLFLSPAFIILKTI